MIFSKTFRYSIVLILSFHYVSVHSTAYEININGQTFQVNVVSQGGEQYHDRLDFTDDFGDQLDPQLDSICSSLRGEQCLQVTNNGDTIPNLFNYFPTHESESIIAKSNSKYNTNKSPYELRQPMNDRILNVLSRQNPYILGTKPLKQFKRNNNNNIYNNLQQQLFDNDPLKLVKSKKIKHKRKKKINQNKNENKNNDKNSNKNDENNDGNNVKKDEEYEDVEVELYSNLEGDTELADALGLDEEELGDTVDRIVAQLVASYLDNDSDEVDVGQIFANEMSVENGEVSMEQINLDEGSMQEMSDLLNTIANKHKKKQIKDGTGKDNMDSDGNGDNGNDNEQAQVFALKFVVDSDDNTDTESDDNELENDRVEKIENNNNENKIKNENEKRKSV